MYRKIEGNQRMMCEDATKLYPDNYIAIQRDSTDSSNTMGTVLFVGDNEAELFRLVISMENVTNCGIEEGVNLQNRVSLEGIELNG